MAEDKFKVTIDGPGMQVSRDLTEAQMLQILPVVFGNAKSVALAQNNDSIAGTDAQPSPTGSAVPKNSMAIGEFLGDLNIENNPDRIAAIALFVKEQLMRPLIARDELAGWFQKAGEPAPKNLTRDITNAVRQKVIAEDNDKAGHYYVTGTGEKKLRGAKKE